MKRESIDFHAVPAHQQGMHERLINWGLSCFSSGGSSASPMFRLYRSEFSIWSPPEARIPVDQQDAAKIAKGVKMLPSPHMLALDWYYVHSGSSPMKARKAIGCTLAGLNQYVIDGRNMLINRRV